MAPLVEHRFSARFPGSQNNPGAAVDGGSTETGATQSDPCSDPAENARHSRNTMKTGIAVLLISYPDHATTASVTDLGSDHCTPAKDFEWPETLRGSLGRRGRESSQADIGGNCEKRYSRHCPRAPDDHRLCRDLLLPTCELLKCAWSYEIQVKRQ